MSDSWQESVRYLNFLALTLLRDGCDRDPISACIAFGLTKSELDELRPHLVPERLLAAVANAPQESFVALRGDIRELLASPPPLVRALSALRSAGRAGSTRHIGSLSQYA